MSTKETNSEVAINPIDSIAEIGTGITQSLKKKSNGKVKPVPKQLKGVSDNEPTLDGRELLRVLSEVKNGNFNVRMPIDLLGIDGKICDTLNDIIYLNEKLMQ